jgi:hypothetical protein
LESDAPQQTVAKTYLDVVVNDLVELAGMVLNKIYTHRSVMNTMEYRLMCEKYYSALVTASDLIPVKPHEYMLPPEPLNAALQVQTLVGRLKAHGHYKVTGFKLHLGDVYGG